MLNTKGKVNFIEGETASGKTTIMLDLLDFYFEKYGYVGCFLSFEISKKYILRRAGRAGCIIYDSFIYEVPQDKGFEYINEFLEDYRKQYNRLPDVLFLDGLQSRAFSFKGKSSLALSSMADELEQMAKELDIAIIMSVQNSRNNQIGGEYERSNI